MIPRLCAQLLMTALTAGISTTARATPEPSFPLGRADTRAPGAGGNDMCPVKPDQLAREKFQIQFHGKRINFCCAECAAKFEQHARPSWARLPQYPPYLSMNWPDPDLDRDRNRVRMNNIYRSAASAGGWASLGISALLVPLGAISVQARLRPDQTAD